MATIPDTLDNAVHSLMSRWYLFFVGFMLAVMGITGLTVAVQVGAIAVGAVTTSAVIWLLTATVALLVAFMVRSARTVRWTAGVIGGVYLIWGLFYAGAAPQLGGGAAAVVAGTGGLQVLLGAIGLASALVPADWVYRHARTEPSTEAM
jgi:hypothetical protein